MKRLKPIWALLPVMCCYIIAVDKPFFWDTVHLASAQANWFYGEGLGDILLPDGIDSGHPPLTGWLLALQWKLFGKGLVQSHLLMLPFLIIALWQMMLLLRHYFPDHHHLLAFVFFLNPILLSQAMLVSPDVILFAGFFTLLHGILTGKKWKILAGSILLAAVSMRGMVCVASLALFSLLLSRKHIVQKILLYIPSALVAGGFLLYHYQAKGWIGYYEGSPWAPSFQSAGIAGAFRNLAVTIWRFCDQGMVFLWIPSLYLLAKNGFRLSARTRELLSLFLILFLLLVLPQLFYKGLLMHRYLYPCIAILTLASFSIACENWGSMKNYVTSISLLLVSGFFWIYPDNIAKGWDVMPLHYRYHSARKQIMDKFNAMGLDPVQTGAGFPYEMPSSVIDLGNDDRHFASPDLQTNRYVLYSNASNDFTEVQVEELRKWKLVARSSAWPIRFELYERP